jgi:hypothetical protein
MWPMLFNGRCSCCGRVSDSTAVCVFCMSRSLCSCGALLACGTHYVVKNHKCPPGRVGASMAEDHQ